MIYSWLDMQIKKLTDTEEPNHIRGGMTISSMQIFNGVEGWCTNSTIVTVS